MRRVVAEQFKQWPRNPGYCSSSPANSLSSGIEIQATAVQVLLAQIILEYVGLQCLFNYSKHIQAI